MCLFTWPLITVYLSILDRPDVYVLVIVRCAINIIPYLSSYGLLQILTIACERPCLPQSLHDGSCGVDVATQTDAESPEEHSLLSPSSSFLTDDEIVNVLSFELPELSDLDFYFLFN